MNFGRIDSAVENVNQLTGNYDRGHHGMTGLNELSFVLIAQYLCFLALSRDSELIYKPVQPRALLLHLVIETT